MQNIFYGKFVARPLQFPLAFRSAMISQHYRQLFLLMSSHLISYDLMQESAILWFDQCCAKAHDCNSALLDAIREKTALQRKWLFLNSKNPKNGLVFSWSVLGRTNSERREDTERTLMRIEMYCVLA